MGAYGGFVQGGEDLGVPPGLTGRRRGFLAALLGAGMGSPDDAQGGSTSSANAQPTGTRPPDRIGDDAETRRNTELQTPDQANPDVGFQEKPFSDHIAQLQSQYDQLGQPRPAPSLKSRILGGLMGAFAPGAIAQQQRQRDLSDARTQQTRQSLLQDMEADRRAQLQEGLANQRMTLQQKLEDQRERERQAAQERLFGQQNELQDRRDTAAQAAQQRLFNQQQSLEDQREASRRKQGEIGTWSLQEDDQGNPVMFNSKSGQTRPAPASLHTRGTYQKTMGGGEDSLQYAKDYLDGKNFTGAGDEALMEKFFDVAKPSTGFRMSQPQQNMLMQTRDMVQGIKARAKHLFSPNAPYFDDVQRANIVAAMDQIMQAKRKLHGGPTQGGAQSSGGTQLKDRVSGRVLVEGKDF